MKHTNSLMMVIAMNTLMITVRITVGLLQALNNTSSTHSVRIYNTLYYGSNISIEMIYTILYKLVS